VSTSRVNNVFSKCVSNGDISGFGDKFHDDKKEESTSPGHSQGSSNPQYVTIPSKCASIGTYKICQWCNPSESMNKTSYNNQYQR
jgi:hypothetical protein